MDEVTSSFQPSINQDISNSFVELTGANNLERDYQPLDSPLRLKMMSRVKEGKLRQSSPRPLRIVTYIAEREHIGRLLRRCQEKARTLLESIDPIESAVIGAEISNALDELWSLRKAREYDWSEILNLIQIVIAGEDFETLPKEKCSALLKVFECGLTGRTVGRSEIERTISILSSAGFDIWKGISEGDRDTPASV